MVRIVIHVIALQFLLLITSACTHPAYLNKPLCSAWCKEYWAKGRAYSLQAFASYDRETQFDIYLCSQGYMHPPALDMAEAYAKLGKDVVPTLLLKLEEATDDSVVYKIIYVFRHMAKMGTYPISDDKETLAAMDAALQRTPATFWRKLAERDVRFIKFHSTSYIKEYSFTNPACTDIVLNFYGKTRAEQLQAIKDYAPREQIVILACGREAAQPFPSVMEYEIVHGGTMSAPVVKEVLRATANPYERAVCMHMLVRALFDNSASAAQDRELLELMARHVSSLEDEWARKDLVQRLGVAGISVSAGGEGKKP